MISLPNSTHIDNSDVILIGSGIMSATLGAMLKCLQTDLSIQLYEVTNELAQESSHGWNNAGTGHAGICELSYPNPKRSARVRVSRDHWIESSHETKREPSTTILRTPPCPLVLARTGSTNTNPNGNSNERPVSH
ncbi:MAG: malate:quinone oxidoreductase [Pirellulaceae bacterium]|nr:malate:quinone oxidoreductase [Pirellulaceae bacterium]